MPCERRYLGLASLLPVPRYPKSAKVNPIGFEVPEIVPETLHLGHSLYCTVIVMTRIE